MHQKLLWQLFTNTSRDLSGSTLAGISGIDWLIIFIHSRSINSRMQEVAVVSQSTGTLQEMPAFWKYSDMVILNHEHNIPTSALSLFYVTAKANKFAYKDNCT